jgi:hypothetical protein
MRGGAWQYADKMFDDNTNPLWPHDTVLIPEYTFLVMHLKQYVTDNSAK